MRKQPVKVVFGDRSNLLPRRQEDLELPMSPIRNPSSLAFLDSNMEMDTHPMHVPHQPHKPGGLEKQRAMVSRLQLSDNQGKLSNRVEYSNSRDVPQLSESLLSFHNSQEQSSLSRHQKYIKQPAPPQVLNYALHCIVWPILYSAGGF